MYRFVRFVNKSEKLFFLYCHSKICCNIKCRSNWGFIVSLLFIKDYSIMWWVFVFLLKVLKCIGDFNFDQNN